MSVNVDQIVVSDKFKHSGEDLKYFVGYQKEESVENVMHYLTSNEWIHQTLWKRWQKHVFFD